MVNANRLAGNIRFLPKAAPWLAPTLTRRRRRREGFGSADEPRLLAPTCGGEDCGAGRAAMVPGRTAPPARSWMGRGPARARLGYGPGQCFLNRFIQKTSPTAGGVNSTEADHAERKAKLSGEGCLPDRPATLTPLQYLRGELVQRQGLTATHYVGRPQRSQ